MKSIIIIFIFLSNFAYGQSTDTVYYGIDGMVNSKDSAFSVRYVTYDSTIKRYKFTEWSLIKLSHKFIEEGELLSLNPEVKDGKFKYVDQFGNIVTSLYTKNTFVDIMRL